VNRSLRLIAALLAILSIAFSQLALSAHGCERMTQHPVDCEKMAPANEQAPSNLCLKHCEDGKASLDVAKLAPIALSLAVLSIPLPPVAHSGISHRFVSPAVPHPPPDTFAARSAALRI